jgi:hypothetical protein
MVLKIYCVEVVSFGKHFLSFTMAQMSTNLYLVF